MKRLGLMIVVGALGAGIGVVLARQAAAFSAVRPVGAVRAGLARDPRAWVGSAVLVRGTLTSLIVSPRLYGFYTQPPRFAGLLTDPGTPLPSPALPLHSVALLWGKVDPLLSQPRRLPLVGRFAPRPQAPRWDAPAVYRVRLVRVKGAQCALPPCYEALLLDAAPQPMPSCARPSSAVR